jgi:putative tributyrin esterase
MAHLRCDFFSEALSLGTSMTVLLPQPAAPIGMPSGATGGPPPVLYLLHGLSDDDTAWLRRTSIERYAAALGLAVVMPQVHRSFYTDQASGGGRYWTFLTEELPELVGSLFRVSQRREDTFAAGLSMGGYGALKWALRQPERFAAAASLSGALDVAALRARRARAEDPRMFDRIFGAAGIPPQEDLFALLRSQAERDLPPLYLGCGTEDALIADNHAFRDACAEVKVPLETSFSAGSHEWGYWDEKIQDVLAWLPLARRDDLRIVG